MNENALIIIDMLNDFIDPEGVLYCGAGTESIIPVVEKLLGDYRTNNAPVIYLQDSHPPDDKEFEKFPPHCITGTWGHQIIKTLAPQPHETVIPKTRYSGFYNTRLDDVLNAIQPKRVDVVGVCTSICVMDTVGGLVNRDYSVRVLKAGVTDFDSQAHAFALQRMEKIYGAKVI
jgi:nicotinamidase-related amidase